MEKFSDLSFQDVALLRSSLMLFYIRNKETMRQCSNSSDKLQNLYQDIKTRAFRNAVDAKTMLLRLDFYSPKI